MMRIFTEQKDKRISLFGSENDIDILQLTTEWFTFLVANTINHNHSRRGIYNPGLL